MRRKPVESSNLVSVGYENGILEIEFHGDYVYQYYDVPEEIYVGLMTAESKGKYLHWHIKTQGYRYKKIEEGISESPLDAANTEEQKLTPCGMLEPIWEAAEGGNWDTVKLWLKHDPSLIGAVGHNDWTLLHSAVFSPSIETLEFLVGQGANVNGKDKFGATPLHFAAEYNSNVEVLKYLISQGADVNGKDKFDKTPFRLAVESNFNTEIVKFLFSQGTKHDNVEIVEAQHECGVDDNDNQKEYLLWLDKYLSDIVTELKELEKEYGVVNRCQLEIEVDELKEELEDLEYQINNEWDCKRGYLEEWEDELEEVSEKLEERENVVAWWETVYDKFDELNKWYITPIQKYATTILQCATEHDANVKVLKYLISQGADANVKDEFGMTLLHLAASTNTNLDVLEYLVSQDVDVNVKNKWGMTPLHLAAESNSKEIMEYLISQGADVNAGDRYGRTPLGYANTEENERILCEAMKVNYYKTNLPCLHKAAEKGQIDDVRYFLDRGINANVICDDCGDKTPLFWAANVEVAKYLVEHGANVNAKDAYGRIILHWATNIEIAKFCLANGADVNTKDILGDTPLHWVKDIEFVKCYLEHGANVHIKNRNGKTPLDIANSKEKKSILQEAMESTK